MCDDVMPCLLDGEVVPDATIRVSARGGLLSHGEGLFETLPVLGGRARFLAAHQTRLDAGCRALGFGQAPDVRVIESDVGVLVRVLGAADFVLRVVVFRDAGALRRLAVPSALPRDVGLPVNVGVVAPAFQGPRALAALKTLNYLVPRLAHEDGARRGFDEVVFGRDDGVVLEGTRSTVFAVLEGRLTTPPLDLPILAGVTREVILACARRARIPVVEAPFTLETLRAAKEAFLTASVRGVRPIASFDGTGKPSCPGPVTERVRALYEKAILAAE